MLVTALCVLSACTAAPRTVAPTRPGKQPLAGIALPTPSACADPAPDWDQVAAKPVGTAEGYSSTDSAMAGTTVGLYISTSTRTFRVDAYRMGFYGAGPAACQVWRSGALRGEIQPPVRIIGAVHAPTASWRRSITVDTTGWRDGDYLFRIDGGAPTSRSFIPFTVRSPSFAGREVLVMPVTTWQAYNDWGGYSLYRGPGDHIRDRARAVPFDRPYGSGQGAASFIRSELPLLTLAQRLGIPLAYATDMDLQHDPSAFLTARAVISVGHDEYYSPTMRQTLTDARDAGVNLAFLGSNAVFRKVRFANTAVGPDRLMINYKDDTDPIPDPKLKTTQWRDPPSDDPESSLVGAAWQCSSKKFYPLVVAGADSWLFDGTGAADGTELPRIAGFEFDGIDPRYPVPRPSHLLFHSPVNCHGRAAHQDSTYYTTPSGAGVFDAGAYFWTCAITNTCPVPVTAQTTAIITRLTANYLVSAAAGPLGHTHPAVDDVGNFYRLPGPAEP